MNDREIRERERVGKSFASKYGVDVISYLICIVFFFFSFFFEKVLNVFLYKKLYRRANMCISI